MEVHAPLGGSDFCHAGGSDAATWDARVIFLHEVAREAPEVLGSLRDDVFPVYVAVAEFFSPDHLPLREWASVAAKKSSFRQTRVPLKDAIEAFATRFHLACPWVMASALETLRAWYKDSAALSPPLAWHVPPAAQRFPFTRAEEEEWNRRKRAHERRKDLYLLARRRGFKKAPRKLDVRHFTWLVRFQVLGRDHSELGDTPGLYAVRWTVSEAVTRTAHLLDLPLRPLRRGRPIRKTAG